MAIEPPLSAEAAPQLQVRTQAENRTLSAGREYHIGRDPQADIVFADSRVSWRHAVLRAVGGSWMFEDTGSTNGTFLGQQRVQQVPIAGPCVIRLGHADNGPSVEFAVVVTNRQPHAGQPGYGPPGYVPPPAAAPGYAPQAGGAAGYAPPAGGSPGYGGGGAPGYAPPAGGGPGYGGGGAPGYPPPAGGAPGYPPQAGNTPGMPPPAPRRSLIDRAPSAVMRLPTRVLRIGRAPDNEVVVPDLSVSRYHAELRREPVGGYSIVDLGSHNGTFLNGQRITAAPVTERDIIGIGPASYRLVGEELQEFLDTGDISFIAQDLSVILPSGKVLMDHMSFPLGGRCLLGVIGPSGAGKSTLLGALTGTRPATHGAVLYDGRDLYSHYAELRHRIGLVPQADILHTQLTPRRSLKYAAELRFPKDTSKAERMARIDEVLADLSLTKHADTKTVALSGGQKKRVNVALELLTKPSLLFLDEPTSGLDPGLDKSVMEQMRDLAHGGRTVIVVTHSVDNLDLCDRLLVLVPGGKIGYFGAPKDGLKYFRKSRWAEVFQAFEDQPDRDWASEFRASPYHNQYITSEMAAGAAQGQRNLQAPAPAPKSSNTFAQLSTLTRRYTAVIASDKALLAFLLGAPVVLGVLVRVLVPHGGLVALPGKPNAGAVSVLMILALGSCFAGGLNSVREIVKEREIYTRERAAGLSAGAYLWSKLIVLSVLTAVQPFILVLGGLAGVTLPSHGSVLPIPLVELILAMMLVSIASMVVGLLISASVSTSERTTPLLLVVVIVQVAMTGGLVPVTSNGLKQIAWFFPARWGFGASASTVNLNVITLSAHPDPVWAHDAKTWITDMALQLALCAVFALFTWTRLRRIGPGKRK